MKLYKVTVGEDTFKYEALITNFGDLETASNMKEMINKCLYPEFTSLSGTDFNMINYGGGCLLYSSYVTGVSVYLIDLDFQKSMMWWHPKAGEDTKHIRDSLKRELKINSVYGI